jgi:uncharacterized protein
MTAPILSEIRRYPVKSMQGELVDRAALTSRGIGGDRVYALRDAETGKVLSAKNPRIASALLSCRAVTTGEGVVVTVGQSGAEFGVADPRLTTELSELLGRSVCVDASARTGDVYESYWPVVEDTVLSDVEIDLPIASLPGGASFADVAPLQILAEESVDHLRTLNPALQLSMDRFRPSLAFRTTETGFVEKHWTNRAASLGGSRLSFGAESPRCVMTTVAQLDLPHQVEVLKTIARHNRVDYGGFGKFACLGVYADVAEPGEIAVGDPLLFA